MQPVCAPVCACNLAMHAGRDKGQRRCRRQHACLMAVLPFHCTQQWHQGGARCAARRLPRAQADVHVRQDNTRIPQLIVQLAPTRRRLQAAPCAGQPGMHVRHQLRQRRHQPRLEVAVCLEEGWGRKMGTDVMHVACVSGVSAAAMCGQIASACKPPAGSPTTNVMQQVRMPQQCLM